MEIHRLLCQELQVAAARAVQSLTLMVAQRDQDLLGAQSLLNQLAQNLPCQRIQVELEQSREESHALAALQLLVPISKAQKQEDQPKEPCQEQASLARDWQELCLPIRRAEQQS